MVILASFNLITVPASQQMLDRKLSPSWTPGPLLILKLRAQIQNRHSVDIQSALPLCVILFHSSAASAMNKVYLQYASEYAAYAQVSPEHIKLVATMVS